MTNIAALLKKAENFEHIACKDCPWNKPGMAFGVCCTKHHLNWKKKEQADIFSIGQDPGSTTPERTGTICAICNSVNTSDGSAQGAFDLLKSAIIGEWDYSRARTNEIFKNWYPTNSLKHGIHSRFSQKEENLLEKKRKNAMKCCSIILKEEIDIIRPKLLLVNGLRAVKMLQFQGIIEKGNLPMRSWVENSPHEIKDYYGDGASLKIFCLYHTAKKVTYQTVWKLHNEETLETIKKLRERHPNPRAVDSFIEKYSKASYTVRKGMLVHLMYFLKLGEVIRNL